MTTQQYDCWGNPIYDLVIDLRTSADSAQEDLNYRHQLLRDAADEIERLRAEVNELKADANFWANR